MTNNSCFSAKIDPSLKEKLENDLKEQGFVLTRPSHTFFSAKKKGVSCTFYESGSFTVQGKEMQEFIEFYLEPEVLKKLTFSHPEIDLDLTPHIGLDEAGKGDFFGPLCVAAVYADKEGIIQLQKMGVKDSKNFSDAAIQTLAKKIRSEYAYTVIRLFPQKYNELYAKFKNLNRLLGWTHVAALGDLSQKTGCKKALLDQFANKNVVLQLMKQKKLEVDLEQKVRGESDLVVAAASILARDGFLDGMQKLSEEIGVTLPKGASSSVVKTGKKLFAMQGEELLKKVAKTHFKTMAIVCSLD